MPLEPELSVVHQTAVGVAAIRAAHLIRDGEPKVMRDTYALALTGWSEEQGLAMADQAKATLPSMYTTWICRGRFAEDRLALARKRGVDQYVVLGAGLDSFALRHSGGLVGLTVYEVDDPPMQDWKRWRLEQLGLAVPRGLRFVACDFETQDLPDVLAASGFDARKATFISWLGVTQYLTPSAICSTLRWAAGLAQGSEILVAYLIPSPEVEAARANGVPFESFFEPTQMEALLRAAGLSAEHYPPDHLDSLYFGGRTDGLRAPLGERLMIGSVTTA